MGLVRTANHKVRRAVRIDPKRASLRAFERLMHIRFTLMQAAENGRLGEIETVSVLELDKLVKEIAGPGRIGSQRGKSSSESGIPS